MIEEPLYMHRDAPKLRCCVPHRPSGFQHRDTFRHWRSPRIGKLAAGLDSRTPYRGTMRTPRQHGASMVCKHGKTILVFTLEGSLPDIGARARMAPTPIQRRACPGLAYPYSGQFTCVHPTLVPLGEGLRFKLAYNRGVSVADESGRR